MAPHLKKVRNKITDGAEQLKGIEGYPLVVVIANPRNSWVPLDAPMFIGALYGDPQASFVPGGGLVFGAGRNGRLQVTERDGSVHGNHPYLGAVAVLRFVYPQDAWAAAMRQSKEAGNDNPLAIVARGAAAPGTSRATRRPKPSALMSMKQSVRRPCRYPVRFLPALMTHAGGSPIQVNMGN